MLTFLFGTLLLFFSPGSAFAGEVMFEGYYRVEIGGKHVGYAIQRYEFDPKAKTFEVTQFLRAKFGDKIFQESLKGKANDKFNPISYAYTTLVNDKLKAVDASFSGNIMKLKINDGGPKVREETHKIPEGTFLSSFLIYVMLQKKLPLNKAFKYSGIAEEEGASYWGKAWLESKQDQGKFAVFRVLNSFKGEEFVSKLMAVPDPSEADKYFKSEILGTESPKQSLTTRLVESPNMATEGQMVPNKTIVSLFGGIPSGKVNMVANPPKEAPDKKPASPTPVPVPASITKEKPPKPGA